jgi:hypothetical protein
MAPGPRYLGAQAPLNEKLKSSVIVVVIIIIIIIMFSYLRFSFPWYLFSLANGEPHHSGFKSQIVALPL